MNDASPHVQPQLPDITAIEDALASLQPFVRETPLVRCEALSRALAMDVWLKNETTSPVASFKLRGALHALACVRRRAGVANGASAAPSVVVSSTGNHGQGVAYAARALGLGADVFLPVAANPVKKAIIRAFGARVHEHGDDLGAAEAVAKRYAAERGLAFIDDGESPDLMAGAATVGLEIARGLEAIDEVFIPMGSGNLAGGAAIALKAIQPKVRVTAVQAKGAPAMFESFHAKKPVPRAVRTEAEGLTCGVPPRLALAALLGFVDDARLTSDEDLFVSVRVLAEMAHVLVEPSGGAGLVGLLDARERCRGKRVVLVLTGANVTLETMRRALEMPSTATGRAWPTLEAMA